MSKKSGLFTGLLVGAGLGLLFAPKKGSETRKELTDKLNELWNKAKEIEFDDVKKSIELKIEELKEELEDLDKEKVVEIAKEKGKQIQIKAEELYNLAVEKGTPILEKAADDVRKKTVELLNNTADKLEKNAKTKKTTKKNN